jgi:hypothetical protein
MKVRLFKRKTGSTRREKHNDGGDFDAELFVQWQLTVNLVRTRVVDIESNRPIHPALFSLKKRRPLSDAIQ